MLILSFTYMYNLETKSQTRKQMTLVSSFYLYSGLIYIINKNFLRSTFIQLIIITYVCLELPIYIYMFGCYQYKYIFTKKCGLAVVRIVGIVLVSLGHKTLLVHEWTCNLPFSSQEKAPSPWNINLIHIGLVVNINARKM